MPIKHIAQSENAVYRPDLNNYKLTYDQFINYYCDFDKEAEMHQNEEFQKAILPSQNNLTMLVDELQEFGSSNSISSPEGSLARSD